MISPAQRLRGAAALVALLALVVGVPWALVVVGGNPLPTSAPSASWVQEPLSGEALLAVLTLIVWCAWAHFVVCVVREVVVQRRERAAHGRGRAVGGHPLARRLVASALLMIGSVTLTAQSAHAAGTQTGSGSGVSVVSAAVADVQAVGEAAGEAADRAAARQAAEQRDAIEEAADNGRDAGVSHELGLRYEVQPPHGRHHDSLWDIAERLLGDGRRWTDLYELNKDRLQADGSSLQDADLIYPGWELVLPDDARGAAVMGLPTDPGKIERGSGGDEQASTGSTGERAGNGQGAAEEGTSGAAAHGSSTDGSGSSLFGAELAMAGGLVAAGVLLGLRRRRGWSGGPPPRGRGTTLADEQSLHLGSDLPAAAVADAGLRRLSAHFGQTSAPVLRTARVNANGFTAAFTDVPDQAPPEGWSILGDGSVWHGPADRLDVDAAGTAPTPSAYADTVVLGTDGGDHVLVNLAAHDGPVTVGGEPETVVPVLRAVAVGLATQTWGDGLTVVAVGLPGRLGGLGADRLVQADTLEALADSAARIPHGRRVAVVLADPVDAAATDRALAALRERAEAVSIVRATRDRDADAAVTVDSHGRLTSPRLRLFAEAARLSEATAARLVELYASDTDTDATLLATDDPVVVPPSAPVSVSLFGPIAVTAPGPVDPERADLLTEVVACLALHPDGVHTSVLGGAIWPRGVDDDVLETTMSRVRERLGPDPDPDAPLLRYEDGRWSLDLTQVHVDWQVIRAHRAAADRGDRPVEHLEHALELVSGAPLSGLPAGRYGWLAALPALRDMHAVVVECAQRLGADTDTHRAEWALRIGLRAVPSCEPLWQQLLRLTRRTGGDVEAVADQMYATLARHGSPLGAEATTDALVHELLPGYALPGRAGQLSA